MAETRTLGEILEDEEKRTADAALNLPADSIQRTTGLDNYLQLEPIPSDLAEEQVYLERAMEVLEDTFDASTEVSSIMDIVSSHQDEGLGEDAARMAEISVESICHRLGLKNPRAMVGMEHFANPYARKTATKVSLEGLGEFLKKIWNHLVALVQHIGRKIREFFEHLTGKRFPKADHVEKNHDAVAVRDYGLLKNKDLINAFGSIDDRPGLKTVVGVCHHIEAGYRAMSDISGSIVKTVSLYEGVIDTVIRESEKVIREGGDTADLLKAAMSVDETISSLIGHSIEANFSNNPKEVIALSKGFSEEISEARESGPFCYNEAFIFYKTPDSPLYKLATANKQEANENTTLQCPGSDDVNMLIDKYNHLNQVKDGSYTHIDQAKAAFGKLEACVKKVDDFVAKNSDALASNRDIKKAFEILAQKTRYLLVTNVNNGHYQQLLIKNHDIVRKFILSATAHLKTLGVVQ